MKRSPSVIAGLATALAVGVTLAIAQGPGPGSGSSSVVRDADGAGLAPELPHLIAAFAREQTATDRLPGDPVRALEEVGDAQPGESPQFARRLETGGTFVYAWPKTNGVCYSWAGSAGCTPTSVLAGQGVVIGTRMTTDRQVSGAPREVTVAALARNGIKEIEFVFGDGRSTFRPVENNALLWHPPELPAAAQWENPSGTRGLRTLR
jgi:hypothetical protein